MEQKQKASLEQSRKWTEQEIRSVLAEYADQNRTVKEFCKLHNVPQWAFYAWKKKYGSRKDNHQPGFVSLQVHKAKRPETRPDDVLFAEVMGEKGKCIRIFQQVPPSYLQALLS